MIEYSRLMDVATVKHSRIQIRFQLKESSLSLWRAQVGLIEVSKAH